MSYRILVIGSGASGLMAASRLIERGHMVSIIEARDRIGGRIHTIRDGFSQDAEAGAEFIHGKQPLTQRLIRKAGAKAVRLEGNHYQVWKGEVRNGDFLDEEWVELQKALGKLVIDTDMASFLARNFNADRYHDLRHRVRGFVEGFDAADVHRVSALSLREEWAGTDEKRQYHIDKTYTALTDYLAKEITQAGGSIFLSASVFEIRWSAGGVKIITEGGKMLEADKVIVTVPLGVLKKGRIRFTPELPQHQLAFEQIGFGSVIKFLFEFDHAFWEDRIKKPMKKVAFIFSDAEIPTWWTQRPATVPLLTGWLGGPATAHLQTDSALCEKAVQSLAYLFNYPAPEVRGHLMNWQVVNWGMDHYSFGAYAYPTIHTKEARLMISTPVADTIYFAGEHVYDGPSQGTVEAALANGIAVADQIAKTHKQSIPF